MAQYIASKTQILEIARMLGIERVKVPPYTLNTYSTKSNNDKVRSPMDMLLPHDTFMVEQTSLRELDFWIS
jgi:hypothetical protein